VANGIRGTRRADNLEVVRREVRTTGKPKTVKVLNFRVVHNSTVYQPDDIVTVPAVVADGWLKNRWVTEDVAT
jgi:hypothetical protein